jgi:hypothetical protein
MRTWSKNVFRAFFGLEAASGRIKVRNVVRRLQPLIHQSIISLYNTMHFASQ